MKERHAGILLPITALPSPYGVGSFGSEARSFVDFLHSAGQRVWQVLPLVPTGFGDSPYSSSCAIAGSPYLIDIDILIEKGLLTTKEAEEYRCDKDPSRVDYESLFYKRIALLKIAFSRFDKTNPDFLSFVKSGDYYDFSVFMTLKEAHSWQALSFWDKKYIKRDSDAVREFEKNNEDNILFWQFTQYEFFLQWRALKRYANDKGVEIMGDMPLYVSLDSAEVWAHPELFLLDEEGHPIDVAGVPPDYFSEDGQLWGNPLYNWERMREDGYAWWTDRLKRALGMYDIVRIDHFRGFDRFYAVPAGSPNARIGKWVDGPKESLFLDKLDWKIVAEDLGTLDEGVYRLLRNTGYPRMKILEFAFDGNPAQEFKPSNYDENCVVYTGTHDNATFIEFLTDMNEEERRIFYTDLALECKKFGVAFTAPTDEDNSKRVMQMAREALIQTAYLSPARYVILPLQDVLGTGGESRMNLPGTLGTNNWSWRYDKSSLKDTVAEKLKGMTVKSDR
ncbi:MAG: 4-alpha-glucanotransferase [Clostridia bacterium]|nr:4-alpha-glucanotransferase [Clostridia bacterium]